MAASTEKAIEETSVWMSEISLSPGGRRSGEKIVQLRCADGKEINLDEATALMSGYVMERLDRARRIEKWDRLRLKLGAVEPTKHMPSDLVERVFHYCRRHAHAHPDEDLEAFDAEIVDLDYPELCKLIKAAIRFEVKGLVNRAKDAYEMTGKDLNTYCADMLAIPF